MKKTITLLLIFILSLSAIFSVGCSSSSKGEKFADTVIYQQSIGKGKLTEYSTANDENLAKLVEKYGAEFFTAKIGDLTVSGKNDASLAVALPQSGDCLYQVIYTDSEGKATTVYNRQIIDNSIDRLFTDKDTAHIRGANYGEVSKAETTVLNDATKAGRTGDFIQVNVDNPNMNSHALKILPTVSQDVLAGYLGGYFVIDYLIMVDGYDVSHAPAIETIFYEGTGDYDKAKRSGKDIDGGELVIFEWSELRIEITQDVIDNWNKLKIAEIEQPYWAGVFLYFGWNTVKDLTGNIYYDNFTITMDK